MGDDERAKKNGEEKIVSKVLMHLSRWRQPIWAKSWTVEWLSAEALIKLASAWMEPARAFIVLCDESMKPKFEFLIAFAFTAAAMAVRMTETDEWSSLGATNNSLWRDSNWRQNSKLQFYSTLELGRWWGWQTGVRLPRFCRCCSQMVAGRLIWRRLARVYFHFIFTLNHK